MIIPFPLIPLCLLMMSRLCMGCSPSCTCKWRNGKQTVECVNKSLIIIPAGIDPATQVLDLSGNNFQYLQRDEFLKMSLVNLQKIFLAQCSIRIIEENSLKGLTNLVELDLSENYLESVPTGALLNCPSLMKLTLSKNPIICLNRLAFNHLSFLTTLDLSGCEINEVHEAAFSGLYSLEWIDLTQNQLASFPDMRLLPSTLKGLQLQDNPWTCDCEIRTFNAWLKRNIVPILIDPMCQKPKKFEGMPVKNFEESELACAPEVSPSSFYFELEENKNITLVCQVKSVPEAKISWLFNEQVLHNNTELFPGLHLVYFIEEGGEEKQSNLFIYNLNSDDNGTFYCKAENPAGVSHANYTIMIILKRKPIAIEEKLEFPIETASIFLTVGLVMLSLCFVALLMTLIRCHSVTKHRRKHPENKEAFIGETKIDVEGRSNSKPTNKQTGLLQARIDKQKEIGDCSVQIAEANPDVINIMNSTDMLDPGCRVLGTKIANNLSDSTIQGQHPLILVNPTLGHRHPILQRTQPYFKPTLISQPRPVSAPSFERFVENIDVRYTADGYPAKRIGHSEIQQSSFVPRSFSEASTPKPILKNRLERLNTVGVQSQKSVEEVIALDDVQL